MKRRKGKLSKKNKQIALTKNDEEEAKVPHTFIIHRGNVSLALKQLESDIRKVMEPYTATNLKENLKSSIKDYVSVCSFFHVTHMVVLTQTEVGAYMKMCRLPHGPTITFEILNYTLCKDVIELQKKQLCDHNWYLMAPCLMTNLKTNEGPKHLQLLARVLLDMFPAISPSKATLKNLKRCCLMHYDTVTDTFDFRHYSIKIKADGISKAVRKLLHKNVPDLSRFSDVSEYVKKAEILSDSEPEDDPSVQVELKSQKLRSKGHPQKAAVRLYEIGPRITIKMIKVEEGLLTGTVLYHKYITKTAAEIRNIEKKLEKRRKLKEQRRKTQKKNVARKEMEKEKHKKQCLGGMKKELSDFAIDDDDDERDYFRKEVGFEPDDDLFPKKRKLKEPDAAKTMRKKQKKSEVFKTKKIKKKFDAALVSGKLNRLNRGRKRFIKK